MSGYSPIWLSGAEALERLKGTKKGRRDRLRLLQRAVRERAILARARNKETDREFWLNMGIGDRGDSDDYVSRIDGPWRRWFISLDAATTDLDGFYEGSEFRAADLIECFQLGPEPENRAADLGASALAPHRERRASVADIHSGIAEVYDTAEGGGSKPPNLKELIEPVQAILTSRGLAVSGRLIQKLADEPCHRLRRGQTGRTWKSLRKHKPA